VLERRLGLGEFLHDRLEAVFHRLLQVHAGQVEVAQRVLDSATALGGGVFREVSSYLGVGSLQFNVL
jgi:hypothetical protein